MRLVAAALGLIVVAGAAAWAAPSSDADADQGASSSNSQDGQAGMAAGAKAFLAMFEKFGLKTTPHISQKVCSVDSDVQEATFISSIPDLQRLEMMNPDLTQTAINMMPKGLTLAFAMQMAPAIVQSTYDVNSGIDGCDFSQFIDAADDFGNMKRSLMFSFHFTRALYKRVNWDGFEAKNLVKIAPRFRFMPAFAASVEREQRQ